MDPGPNACGGCGALPGEPGAPCGMCAKYVCKPDKVSLSCPSTCGTNETCLNDACACVTDMHACPGKQGCYADSATSCGASCKACPTATNGAVSCQAGGLCALTCNPGYLVCNGSPKSCTSDRWSFESGGLEGFQILSARTVSDATDSVSVVTTRAADGTHSLAVHATFDCNLRSVVVGIYPCGSGTAANFQNRTLKFQVYLEGPALEGDHQASAILLNGSGAIVDVPPVVGKWTAASLPFTAPSLRPRG